MLKLILLSSVLGMSLALEANLDFMFNWTHIERKGCRFSDYVSAKQPNVPYIENAPMDYLFMQNLGFGINRVTRQCPLIADGENCYWKGPLNGDLDPVGGAELSCEPGEFVSHVRCSEGFEDCLAIDFLCCAATDGRVTDFQREQWCQEIEGRWNVDQMPRSECAKWPVIDEVIVGFHCRGATGCEYPKTRCAPLVQPEELSDCSHSGDFGDGESSPEGPIVKMKCTGEGCNVFDVQQCPHPDLSGSCSSAGAALSDETVSCPEGQYASQITNVGGGVELCCAEGPVDHGADHWTIEFSERFDLSSTEDLNRARCRQNHVVIGVHCRGANCEYKRLRCAPIGSESGCAWGVADGVSPINAVNVEGAPVVRSCGDDSGADCSTVGPISGRTEEANCPEGQFVTDVICDDDACSSVSVQCCSGSLVADHGDDVFSLQFSSEFGPNREAHGHTHNPELPMTDMTVKNIVPEGHCPEGTFMIGMRCEADGCAAKRIRCAPLVDGGDESGCAVGLGDDSPATGLKCEGPACETLVTKQCPFTSGSDCSDVEVTGIGKAECPEDQYVSQVSQSGSTVTVTCCSAEAGTVADHGQAIGWSPQITGDEWDESFTSNCPTHEIMFASLLCTSEAECEKQSMYCESQTFFYECPYDQVLVAVSCEDDDCNLKRFNCAPLLPADERVDCAWTDFYGEDNNFGEDMAIPGAPIVSIRCSQPDCLTVATKQCDFIKPADGSCFWRNEGLKSNVKCRHNCPAGMYIAGLRCTDTGDSHNCEDLQYQCCLPADGEAQVINFVDQDFRSPEFTGSVVDRWRLNEAHCSYGTVLIGLICTGCDTNIKRALCAYTEFNWGDPLPNADLPLYNL